MTSKRFDPLWEVVDEKVPLQGQGADVDAVCPHCHVSVHLGSDARSGERYACGLCGGVSEVVEEGGELRLKAADATQ